MQHFVPNIVSIIVYVTMILNNNNLLYKLYNSHFIIYIIYYIVNTK